MNDNVTEIRQEGELKKVLKPIHLWGISVGLVISGDFYGFSYGFNSGGPASMLVSFIPVTIMYVTFIFCYTELATSIPNAGGASAYARRAMGKFAGYITGISVFIAFLVSPCAVAISEGKLFNYLFPSVPSTVATAVFFCLFVVINLFGVKSSSIMELVVTLIALSGIVLFVVIAAPHFESENFFARPAFDAGFSGVAGAMTFSMWFYFAIDGAAMNAEEMENPKRDIPRGYIPAIVTLMVSAMVSMFFTAGISDYREIAKVDFPLVKSLELALGNGSIWPKVIAVISLFSMVASFSAIILALSRQTFALGRGGYMPAFFSKLNKWGSPTFGLLIPGVISFCLAMTGKTDVMVIISVFAAIVMYIMSIISLFILRKKEPELHRPFRVPYPAVPVISFITVILLFICALVYYIHILIWVVAVYAVAVFYYLFYARKHIS